MAWRQRSVTLGAAATQVITTHTPVRHIIIFNPTGNASVTVGTSAVTAAAYAFIISAGNSKDIGPFSGDAPLNLDEIWLLGALNDIVRIGYVTH